MRNTSTYLPSVLGRDVQCTQKYTGSAQDPDFLDSHIIGFCISKIFGSKDADPLDLQQFSSMDQDPYQNIAKYPPKHTTAQDTNFKCTLVDQVYPLK